MKDIPEKQMLKVFQNDIPGFLKNPFRVNVGSVRIKDDL